MRCREDRREDAGMYLGAKQQRGHLDSRAGATG